MSATSENSHQQRLCHVKKTYPEQEYGFNLHGEKGKKAQYIGSVDTGSPADYAGLQPGDKILEVNGSSILHDDHKHVVAKIREDPMQCKLLVVEDESTAVALGRKVPEKKVDQLKNIVKNERQPPNKLSGSLSKQPKPRLCRLNKTSTSDEYGFNLHAESSKGYFIGKVDKNSIAEIAGLVEGQRIVGANKTLIYPSTAHKEVVTLIKQNPICVLLLVAFPEVDDYYQKNSVEFNFDDVEHVQNDKELNGHLATNGAISETKEENVPSRKPIITVKSLSLTSDNLTNGINLTTDHLTNAVSNGKTTNRQINHQVAEKSKDEQSKRKDKSTSSEENPVDRRKNDSISHGSTSSNDSVAQQDRNRSTSTNGEDDLFSGKISVAQMRQRLANKKKSDARNENNLSLMEKYEIIKNL